jgi:SET domain-containing protein
MEIVLPDVVVRDTGTEKGLAVYAKKAIHQGEIVELCPVMAFSKPFDELPDVLKTRVFDWAALSITSHQHAIALGFGSLYNHANPANMRYEACLDGKFLQFRAVRDIAKGEELTINYNGARGDHESNEDDWFDRTKIKPIP